MLFVDINFYSLPLGGTVFSIRHFPANRNTNKYINTSPFLNHSVINVIIHLNFEMLLFCSFSCSHNKSCNALFETKGYLINHFKPPSLRCCCAVLNVTVIHVYWFIGLLPKGYSSNISAVLSFVGTTNVKIKSI